MAEQTTAPSGASCVSKESSLDEMLSIEIDILTKLDQLPKEVKLRILGEEAKQTLTTYPETVAFTKDVRIGTAKKIKTQNEEDPNYIPVERFTTEMGVDGMVHIIKDSGTVDSAYVVVSEKHSKEVDQLKEMATKEHYNRQEILESTGDVIPEQIGRIQESGLYSMLTDKTTINSMFNNTYTTMVVLGELDTLRKKVTELEARQTVSETRLDMIGEHLSGSDKFSLRDANKQSAIKLKALGYNNTQIAESLGIRRETVSRWLKALKS